MSRRVWAYLGIGVIAVGLASNATAQPREAAKPADLAAEVKALREKVAALEERLDSLERVSPPVVPQGAQPEGIKSHTIRVPGEATVPADMPRGTRAYKFNGSTYYVMPVGESDGPVTSVPSAFAVSPE